MLLLGDRLPGTGTDDETLVRRAHTQNHGREYDVLHVNVNAVLCMMQSVVDCDTKYKHTIKFKS